MVNKGNHPKWPYFRFVNYYNLPRYVTYVFHSVSFPKITYIQCWRFPTLWDPQVTMGFNTKVGGYQGTSMTKRTPPGAKGLTADSDCLGRRMKWFAERWKVARWCQKGPCLQGPRIARTRISRMNRGESRNGCFMFVLFSKAIYWIYVYFFRGITFQWNTNGADQKLDNYNPKPQLVRPMDSQHHASRADA